MLKGTLLKLTEYEKTPSAYLIWNSNTSMKGFFLDQKKNNIIIVIPRLLAFRHTMVFFCAVVTFAKI